MEFDTKIKLGFIIWILIIIFLGGLAFMGSISRDEACKEIGLVKSEYMNDMNYCRDSQGNLHYAMIECPMNKFACEARLISVGNVRVVEE